MGGMMLESYTDAISSNAVLMGGEPASCLQEFDHRYALRSSLLYTSTDR
jgi:hypothetical protein